MRASGALPQFVEADHLPYGRGRATSQDRTLLEREGAMNDLGAALAACDATGQFVAISGEAGVGKTALLEAFVTRDGRIASVLWGACEALDTPRPLGPVLDMAGGLGPDFEALVASSAPPHQVFAAFAAALARRDRPTIVIVEDLHWADGATLDLLYYVGRRIHRLPVLLVATWRASEIGPDHPLHRLAGELAGGLMRHIELLPLSPAAVRSLAGDRWNASALFALTNGNPFFVEEVLRSGIATVPTSVRQAILSRRARLPVDARQVLDLVSVVPVRAELEIVRASVTSVSEALVPAVEAGLLVSDARSLWFRHELARLAVLESLPVPRVQELHRTVLETLAEFADRSGVLARLVHHAVGAGDREAVRRFATAAATQAAMLGAHREAAAHYRTALSWSDGLGPASRAEIADALAHECYLTGELVASRDAREQALRLWRQLQVPGAIGRDVRRLSRLAWFLGDRAEAIRKADEALQVLAPLGDDGELAMALSNRAQLHMQGGEHDACSAMSERVIELARRAGSVEPLSHALNNLGTSRIEAGDASGQALLEESLRLALEHDLHEHAARAFVNLSGTSVRARDYDTASRWLRDGIAYSEGRDLESWRTYLVAWRARLLEETGHWPEAEAEAAAVIRRTPTPGARVQALATLGLLLARQRKAEATALLDEALALALPLGESQRLLAVRAARAEHALLQGRLETARAEADAGLAESTPQGRSWDRELLQYLRWRAGGGRPAATPGPEITPGPHGLCMRGDWRAAADAWMTLGCPYERAEALADGDVPAMEQALQAFLSLGASPAADRVRQRLRRAGITRFKRGPRKSTRAHPAGLTRRETEILALLASRMSNPEIGERLFVSPKTVEHHVSAILGKLEVASRDAAVTEAQRRGWLMDR